MDGLKPAGSRAFDVRKNIIEENSAGTPTTEIFSLKMTHKIAEVPGPVQPIDVGESL
jgi:hypothetical protein